MRYTMKYQLFIFVLLFSLCFSCSPERLEKENSPEDPSSIFSSDDVIAGMIRLKLDRATATALETPVTKGMILPDNIISFKELCSKYNIVKMERIFLAGDAEARTRKAGLDLWYTIYFSAKEHNSASVAGEFAELAGIHYVEPVYKVKRVNKIACPMVAGPAVLPGNSVVGGTGLPFDDPLLPEQWNFHNDGSIHSGAVAGADINVFPAWEQCTGNPEVIVAVVDEGVQYNHPDLAANMWSGIGYNFCDGNAEITWHEGHGTHVAGMIAAVNNNGIGISSVAGGSGKDDGVKIMTCEVFNANGEGGTDNACAAAIKYAADHGALICQNSWGYEAGTFASESQWKQSNRLTHEAIDYFVTYAGMSADGQTQTGLMAGGVVVFSAGNDSKRQPAFPGAYSKCMNVASISCNFLPAYYTNYGSSITICAPGGGPWKEIYTPYEQGFILSTLPTTLHNGEWIEVPGEDPYQVDYVKTEGYGYMQGTSMACPQVSGVAALLVSRFGGPGFTNDQLKDLLYNTARDISEYTTTVGRLVDAGAAFDYNSDDVPIPVITPASGQSSRLYLLSYETRHLTFTLHNYTGYAVSDESGKITHSQSGDEVRLYIKAGNYTPGHYSATLTARNRAKSANLTIDYTIEENLAPQLVKSFRTMCFSGTGITQRIRLSDYLQDPNDDLERYSVKIYPLNVFKLSLTGDELTVSSQQSGSATLEVTAIDKGGLTASSQFTVSVNGSSFEADYYPNPCRDVLHIQPGILDGEELRGGARLSIRNTTGTEVLKQTVNFGNSGIADLDVSSLPSGKYLLTLSCHVNNRTITSTQTIFKQ